MSRAPAATRLFDEGKSSAAMAGGRWEETKSFRVFVSSTFEDMSAERTALHDGVFPAVAKYCVARGARFEAIDLRWGISEGDSRARRTMRICLDEMRRSRELSPRLYLLVLLGDRYGWRPLPWRLPGADFDSILAAAGSERAAFAAWYDRDDNAVPVEYRLRDSPRGAGAPSEDELRDMLDRAIAAFLAPGDPRWVAYAGSAVHQEIMEARRHTPDPRGALCYVRQPRPAPEEQDIRPTLGSLEQELRGWLGASVCSYTAALALDAFCREVECALTGAVDAALADAPQQQELAGEIAAHAQFAAERMTGFQGRVASRRRLQRYLSDDVDRPFVVLGVAGCGKSALIAQAAEDTRTTNAGSLVVQRFVGATARSSDLHGLLDGLREEISATFDAPPQPAAHDIETAIARWLEVLRLRPPARQLVVFLDAIDQVENREGVDLMDWLPGRLPPGTKVVASLADPAAADYTTAPNDRASLRLTGLSWPQARVALHAWLDAARRTLQPAQERAIRTRFERCPLPLFLKLAFEQARGWTSGDRRVRVIRGLEGIVDAALDELEASHGAVLVAHALRYLGVARFGLAEDEMVRLLGQRRDVLSELRRRSPESPRADELPVAVWARLYADLSPYLARRSGAGVVLLGFYHRVVGERAAHRYGATLEARRAHGRLAWFFGGRPVLRAAAPDGETPDARATAELPFHLTHARMWTTLRRTLEDLRFVQAKCIAGMVHDLINDYEAALQAGGGRLRPIEPFLAFVRREAHNLNRYAAMPAFLHQQAHNFRRGGPVREAGSAVERAAAPWFRRLNLPNRDPILQATMIRHADSVLDCAFTADSRHLFSCGNDGAIRMWTPERWAHIKRVAQLPDKVRSCDASPDASVLFSASTDGVVRRHDLRSGEVLEFRHRVPAAERCRVSTDGRHVLVCGEKGAALFERSGRRLWSRKGVYYDAAFRSDGIAALVGDGVLLVDIRTGAKAGARGFSARSLYACAFSPDRRTLLVAGGTDTALSEQRRMGMAWTLDAGTLKPTETPHEFYEARHKFPESALSCRFLPDGRAYAIGLRSGSLEIFRTADGRRIRTVGDHTAGIRGIAVSPDGRHLVTASLDSRLHAYACRDLGTTEVGTPAGGAAFCAFATGGREARVWHARASNVEMEFGETLCAFDAPDPRPSHRALDPDVGFGDVRIAGPGVAFNTITGTFLRSVDAGRRHTPHRTSPIFGRLPEAYWLFAVGSRMTDFHVHLLPPLDDARQHSRALTWARSEDKWRTAVLRTDGLTLYRDDLKQRVELKVPQLAPRGDSPPLCLFSRGGDRLFFTAEHAIAVVDVEHVRIERLLDCSGEMPAAFCESADRKRLVGGGANGSLWEWDLDSGVLRWQRAAHEGTVVDCAYLGEREVLSIGHDEALCLWDPGTDARLAVYCPDASLSAFSVSADNRFVLGADVHGGVHMLELMRPAALCRTDTAAADPWAPLPGRLASAERMVHDVIAPRLAAAEPRLDLALICVFRDTPAGDEEWQVNVAGEHVRAQRETLPPVDVIIKASFEDWKLILIGELPVKFELFGSRPSVTGELGSILNVLPALFPSARSE
jgi:WD40 repeat protein